MAHLLPSSAALLALLLAASTALADRVAVLPARGGTDEAARAAAQAEILRGLGALGHTPVADAEVAAAQAGLFDGEADRADEFQFVAEATKADWVVFGLVEPAVATTRVELTAYLASTGRVESVAREIDRARSAQQTQEVLAVLMRPEGVGVGELPWERPPPAPPPAAPPPPATAQIAVAPPKKPPPPEPEAPRDGLVTMDYPFDTQRVWPAYSAGRRLLVTGLQGFAVAAERLEGATGSGASIVAGGRVGYAVGDRGLELFADLGGNLVGPPALWVDGGARLMFTPSLHRTGGSLYAASIYMGPEITVGAFFRYSSSEVAGPGGTTYSGGVLTNPIFGAALNFGFAVSPAFQIEAQVGNVRWIPTDEGSLLLFGATLGAGLRF